MPFRTPLDLKRLISTEDLAHYQDSLAGKESSPRREAPTIRATLEPDGSLTLWGTGPDQCSSCTSLAVLEVCWDVCGYYRALGVHWTASRRELMRAYHRLGGPGSEYLTYVLSQLVNRETRRRYNWAALGELPMIDRDARARVKAMAQQVAGRRSEQRGHEVTPEDVLSEWGIELTGNGPAPAAMDGAAPVPGAASPGPAPAPDTPPEIQYFSPWMDQWSWYTLGLYGPPSDASKLEEWQLMLCAAFVRAGLQARFSVGFHPGQSWKILRLSEGRCIFLIGIEPPTPSEADRAVEGYEARERNGDQ